MDQRVGQQRSIAANAIRALAMDAVEKAKSGHPGLPMGMADVVAVLFGRFVKIDPTRPDWPDRDRIVHSAGHGSMLLYAIHHLLGYEDMDREQLENFRQVGSRTAGHPEYGHALGIETTTGPLGQGLANAVGMALAERIAAARFGDDLVDHHTYVVAGDGCLMEGISHEAIDLAGHLRLGKLIVLWDDNQISIDGPTSLATSTNQRMRFEAANWHVGEVDGHDAEAVAAAIEAARADPRPSMIACRTIIGYGAPNKQGTHGVHGAPLGADEVSAAREALGWEYPPFEVPDEARKAWRAVAQRGTKERERWQARYEASDRRAAFEDAHGPLDDTALANAINEHKRSLSQDRPKIASRVASQKALEVVNATLSNVIGGSADLTGSNNTKTEGMRPVTAQDYSGDYVHYGVREHGMAAAMSGIALHGGFIPYGGTFLCFADYSRPAIRLAALMGIRVIHVMTHDSIGLGEDGPTHQPVEQLASLRAMPNILVMRPADAVETAECWQVALHAERMPSIICLSRQGLPTLRTEHTDENLVARGAYLLRDPERRDVTLIATGSEVTIALQAAEDLAQSGIEAAVVSAPCLELFAGQGEEYVRSILGTAPRIAVEAAAQLGWYRWVGDSGRIIAMTSFGASGQGPALYEHFNITPARVVEEARALLDERGG